MTQPQCPHQTFELQRRSINLNLWIELVGNTDIERVEELTSSSPSTRNSNARLLLVNSHEEGAVDSMTELKERLQLAEMNCLRLESLYQKYRLRWLEERHRAMILEEYAPNGIITCSSSQIAWDTPSPAQRRFSGLVTWVVWYAVTTVARAEGLDRIMDVDRASWCRSWRWNT
ncbi:hypothetical protein F4604DRAFT_1687339 [Suillus subluteus]|nr:hypothetical protein F4604DRAFT_1687339 [Suillus subluteus]